ncbi:MAG: helix-turn-helix domain-containing protein [Vicinamibacterales bacterium]
MAKSKGHGSKPSSRAKAGSPRAKESVRQKTSGRKPRDRYKAAGFSRRIREAAEHIGGNAELARRLGLAPQTVSNWTGQAKPRIPGADRLALIADATGADINWLATGEGVPFPPPVPDTQVGQAQLVEAAFAQIEIVEHATRAVGNILGLLASDSQHEIREGLLAAAKAATGLAKPGPRK